MQLFFLFPGSVIIVLVLLYCIKSTDRKSRVFLFSGKPVAWNTTLLGFLTRLSLRRNDSCLPNCSSSEARWPGRKPLCEVLHLARPEESGKAGGGGGGAARAVSLGLELSHLLPLPRITRVLCLPGPTLLHGYNIHFQFIFLAAKQFSASPLLIFFRVVSVRVCTCV